MTFEKFLLIKLHCAKVRIAVLAELRNYVIESFFIMPNTLGTAKWPKIDNFCRVHPDMDNQ